MGWYNGIPPDLHPILENRRSYPKPVNFNFMDREEKEYRKVKKMVREKKGDLLGKWLEKFSVEGDFWRKEKKLKIKKENYL